MLRFLLILSVLAVPLVQAKNFQQFPRTKNVVNILVNEHDFDRSVVEGWMASGTYREESVSNLAAPAETTRSYVEYKPMFLSWLTIRQGRQFIEEHQALLAKAEEDYGVPAEIITAIIGIESRYGRSLGRHNTFNALGSLAVTEGRRADYFQREWIKFIVYTRALGMDPLNIKGSYAGATGYPQFMPTSYEAYAVDHDNDGDIDIWQDAHDAIGSVANYLSENGWKRGQPIISKVLQADESQIKINSFARDRKLTDLKTAGWTIDDPYTTDWYVFPVRLDTDDGQEYWLGYRNFWSISRYNRSISYTMAVVELSVAIAEEVE